MVSTMQWKVGRTWSSERWGFLSQVLARLRTLANLAKWKLAPPAELLSLDPKALAETGVEDPSLAGQAIDTAEALVDARVLRVAVKLVEMQTKKSKAICPRRVSAIAWVSAEAISLAGMVLTHLRSLGLSLERRDRDLETMEQARRARFVGRGLALRLSSLNWLDFSYSLQDPLHAAASAASSLGVTAPTAGTGWASVKEKFAVHIRSEEEKKALKSDSFARLHQATLLSTISSFAQLGIGHAVEGGRTSDFERVRGGERDDRRRVRSEGEGAGVFGEAEKWADGFQMEKQKWCPNADWLLQTAVQLQTAANGLYHQVLRNEDDAIYTASVRCGQQELRAIPDTGSSELVVFAEGCKGCGAAVETGYKPSTSVEVGHLVQLITYGSGSVLCREAIMGLGPIALAETLQDLRKLHEIAETLEAHHLMSPFLRHRLKEQQQAHLELASLNDSVPATLHLRFLSTWPILEFQLGGEHLSLSAQALLGMVKGLMPLPWRSSYQQHPFVVVEACELLVMETLLVKSGDDGDFWRMTGDTGDINTEWGPLWILGMPFFRQYYTTFDYGAPKSHAAGRTPPAVWVAESTEQCTPRAASTHVQLVQHGPVQVDLAKLRLPEWMANRANRSEEEPERRVQRLLNSLLAGDEQPEADIEEDLGLAPWHVEFTAKQLRAMQDAVATGLPKVQGAQTLMQDTLNGYAQLSSALGLSYTVEKALRANPVRIREHQALVELVLQLQEPHTDTPAGTPRVGQHGIRFEKHWPTG
eukprot:g31445.t1